MSQDEKSRGVIPNFNPQNQYQYGTFQGVANYYPPFPQQQLPPPPQQPFVGLPHPIPPPCFANPYVHGYQTVTGFPVEEAAPVRQPRLPVCGLGIGWSLFFLGFFFGGIPWFVGTFVLLCVRVDNREKAGYLACAIASVIAMIVVTFGLTKGGHAW
ncbi:Ribosomal protein L18ae/LX family protein [Hibiscus syriacus]|uniref:Ribosomal protein L18ae/LX family protein n=1 Tax=Hibiscus syriacus TaxID=106335 RepID=A0A6A2X155_HIBSY|nr:60S ribosomal protein L18a-like protein [Hibiscus syriacus]KAE8655596.1 Ribosomal protein L18ae/LX family protein [Hibiscus syriacus]